MHLQLGYGTLKCPWGRDIHQPEHGIVGGSRVGVVSEPGAFLQPTKVPAFKMFCNKSIRLSWAKI